ncbi:MAG: MBL fold metallo-hydrolase RNA specificity domain-containing protein [Bryobacteraceae bacterium]
MRVTFWGAAQTVTGSMHLVEAGGKRILLDCGLCQGRRKEADERNRNLPFRGSSIDAVVLSHAHTDHSGNLPSLVKSGFAGPIYTTRPTIDLCEAMLADTAHIQEKDAEFVNKRRAKRSSHEPPVEPLYTIADAERTMPLFHEAGYHQEQALDGDVRYHAFDAGHMLGSSSVTIESKGVTLTFSGDVGRKGLPIIPDPERAPASDYLIMESTYGNRLHQDEGAVADKLARIVSRTCERGGKIIVPAFAVGRTQQLVLVLHELTRARRIPDIPIFVDSPLAVNVTEVFRKSAGYFDDQTREFLERGEDPFGFARLRYIRDAAESKKLNDLHGPFLVISASGMCEAGRILHHLRNNIEDGRNTVLITGFQAEHTLGRKLVDKWPEVPIFGEPMRVRAEVAKLNELSGHADQSELLEWMKPLAGGLKRVFLVHGERSQSAALAQAIEERFSIPASVPRRGEGFTLD